jgi:glycine/D-amino acid oxidase-like deaminating enzyme
MCLFPASPVGDLQALLDARVAEPVLPGPAVDCEQREFDHESVAIRERRPAERAATRHDEIGGCGDRLPLNRGVECVGTRREHLDKRSQQSALAQQRFERPSNPSAVGDRPAIDRRSDCLPGIDHPGDGVVVLVENPLVNLSHVPQRRNATDKKDSVQAPADGTATPRTFLSVRPGDQRMTVDDGPPTGRRETGDREVTVVGAGAVGITTAHDLARAGADVTVYERAEVAGGASGRAAGVCYDAFATRPDAELGATAIERFRAFAAEGAPFTPCPYVWLAREGDERVALVREGIERMHELGTDVIELDAAALGERFPALRTDDVAIAGLTTGAGFADTGAYTAWLAARARAAGATIREERPVDLSTDPPGVVPRTGPKAGRLQETGTLVVAAGARSKRLLADAGVSIPMKPYRVQALVGALGDDWPPAGRSPAASGAAIKRLSHTVGQKYVNICPSDEGTEGREARDARPATSGARRDQRERLGLRERRPKGAVSGPDTPESGFHTGGRKSARIFVRQYKSPPA